MIKGNENQEFENYKKVYLNFVSKNVINNGPLCKNTADTIVYCMNRNLIDEKLHNAILTRDYIKEELIDKNSFDKALNEVKTYNINAYENNKERIKLSEVALDDNIKQIIMSVEEFLDKIKQNSEKNINIDTCIFVMEELDKLIGFDFVNEYKQLLDMYYYDILEYLNEYNKSSLTKRLKFPERS